MLRSLPFAKRLAWLLCGKIGEWLVLWNIVGLHRVQSSVTGSGRWTLHALCLFICISHKLCSCNQVNWRARASQQLLQPHKSQCQYKSCKIVLALSLELCACCRYVILPKDFEKGYKANVKKSDADFDFYR